jgi:spermidine synthase
MINHLEERKIKTSLFTGAYIEHRLDERWLKWFHQSMEARTTRLNSDFRPVGVFYSLSYWNALFSPYLTGVFKWFAGMNITAGVAVIASFTFLIGSLSEMAFLAGSPAYAILTTGLSAMIFDLAIIFTFQTLCGYLYHQIGLLVAVFMVGALLSAVTRMNRRIDRIKRSSSCSCGWKEGSSSSPFSFLSYSPSHPTIWRIPLSIVLYGAFFAMSFRRGFDRASVSAGFQDLPEPSVESDPWPDSSGSDGADLLGGFLGGLFGCLPPAHSGTEETCYHQLYDQRAACFYSLSL